MFYMLSAYVAFLIGYSPDLSSWLLAIIPFGFVAGYLLDRLNSVKAIWAEDQHRIIRIVVKQYFLFLLISALFFAVGLFLGNR